MRGKNTIRKRTVEPDEKYQSVLVSYFINLLMQDGKKEKAKKVFYSAMDIISEKTKTDPLMVLEQAIKNASPTLEVRSKRIGGAAYQIPVEVRQSRKIALVIRWMIKSARDAQGKSMSEFIAQEIIDAFNNTGAAIKKKEDMHRMAEANKAFAHFARM